ncbi:hypothetical protein CHU98_g5071 [Xylaria longipes]|nr:hypothetical protein CHU98_g5071 [Xylaria longipes]
MVDNWFSPEGRSGLPQTSLENCPNLHSEQTCMKVSKDGTKFQSRDDAGSRVPLIGRARERQVPSRTVHGSSIESTRARLRLHPGEGKRWDEKGHRGDRTKKGRGRLPASRAIVEIEAAP